MNNYFKKYLKYKQKYYNLKYGGRGRKTNVDEKVRTLEDGFIRINEKLVEKGSGDVIGKGSFGTVTAVSLIPCALKGEPCFKKFALKKILIKNADELNKVKREIEVLEKLKGNPKIITLHGVMKKRLNGKSLFTLIFEFIPTGTLEENIRELSDSEKLFIVYQLLKGVLFIHENGIIHLDLKPENLFLLRGIYPKLIIGDFGESNYADKAGKDNVGTPLYLFPKKKEAKNSKINDKWSCGLIIYYLFTENHFYSEKDLKNKLFLFYNKIFLGIKIKDKNFYINKIKNRNLHPLIKNIIIKLFNNEKLNDILALIYKELDKKYKELDKKYKEIEMNYSYESKVQGTNKKKREEDKNIFTLNKKEKLEKKTNILPRLKNNSLSEKKTIKKTINKNSLNKKKKIKQTILKNNSLNKKKKIKLLNYEDTGSGKILAAFGINKKETKSTKDIIQKIFNNLLKQFKLDTIVKPNGKPDINFILNKINKEEIPYKNTCCNKLNKVLNETIETIGKTLNIKYNTPSEKIKLLQMANKIVPGIYELFAASKTVINFERVEGKKKLGKSESKLK